jgi:HNH endonuclease
MSRKPIPPRLRALVLSRDGSRCLMCGASASDPNVRLEVDHVRAVDDGGTDDLENLATLCQPCNRGKSNLKLKDYRELTIVPNALKDDFRSYHDDKWDDDEHLHLYLKYVDRRGIPPTHTSFHRKWTITGTEWETSRDRKALKARRVAEESEKFEKEIRRELAESSSRLIRTERGLERIAIGAPDPGPR